MTCTVCEVSITRQHGQFDDTGYHEAIAEWNTRTEPPDAQILAHPKVRGLVEALELIVDAYGCECAAEVQAALAAMQEPNQ